MGHAYIFMDLLLVKNNMRPHLKAEKFYAVALYESAFLVPSVGNVSKYDNIMKKISLHIPVHFRIRTLHGIVSIGGSYIYIIMGG